MGGGAIAEVDQSHVVIARETGAQSQTDGMGNLAPHRARNRGHPQVVVGIVVRHLPALGQVAGISEELAEKVDQGKPLDQGGAQLPVAGDDPVPRFQGERASDDGRFLPLRPDVESEPALSLKPDHLVVDPPVQAHQPVEMELLIQCQGRNSGTGLHVPAGGKDRVHGAWHASRIITAALEQDKNMRRLPRRVMRTSWSRFRCSIALELSRHPGPGKVS